LQWHFKSTKTRNKKAALEICRAWEQAAKIGRNADRLTPEVAREIVARGVADIFTAVNSETMPSASVRTWCRQWLDAKAIEAEPSTVTRYNYALEHFLTFLGPKAERDIASVRPSDVTKFRDQQARLSRATANFGVKVLRACFNAAFKQGLLTSNPAAVVDKLKQRGECKRRAFTLDELRRVLDAAKGSDWYGATLTSLYTGARLSDTARLTWRAVDLQQDTLAFVAKKTGKRVLVPLAKPLSDFLASLPSSDSPDAALFPSLATLKVSQLSDGFRDVLVSAGMAEARSHEATGKGRNSARPVAELSFHSLRHSFVSILKSTGANEAVAMALAGHETKSVSQNYTHLSTDVLRAAVSQMTDVTAKRKTKAAK
jgi:integrase